MDILYYSIAIVILVGLSAFFSATETAFSSLNKIRLKNMATNDDKRSKMIVKLSEDYDRLISTILIGNNIVNIAAATISTLMFALIIKSNMGLASTLSTVVTTIIVLIFGEITPKTLAKQSPEYFTRIFAPFIMLVYYIFYPLTFLISMWQRLMNKLFKKKDDDNITDEELITIVDEAETEGGLDKYESELIRSAIEFDDLTVMDILTPRVDVEAIELKEKMSNILKVFRETGYSRLPVYKDSIDTIVGILNEKDFYKVYLDGNTTFEKVVVDNIIYATPRMKISILLRKLQKAKTHIAIVVDEFGGTMGIVTLEDILEELVGEIWDEHDEVVEFFNKIEENKFSVQGETNLDEFFDFFDVNNKDEEYEPVTLSGFLVLKLGRIPMVGDMVKFENLTITVTETEFHKISEVEVAINQSNAEENSEHKEKDSPSKESESLD